VAVLLEFATPPHLAQQPVRGHRVEVAFVVSLALFNLFTCRFPHAAPSLIQRDSPRTHTNAYDLVAVPLLWTWLHCHTNRCVAFVCLIMRVWNRETQTWVCEVVRFGGKGTNH
jgi:hypothetical protein